MCGRFNVTDDPRLYALLDALKVARGSSITTLDSVPSSPQPTTLEAEDNSEQFALALTPSSEPLPLPKESSQLKAAAKNSQGIIISDDIAPASDISIVLQQGEQRIIQTANWWLLQELKGESYVPLHQYASFNSRSDKLNVPNSASYEPYRYQRCVIPASGFIEGLGDKKTYHAIVPQQEAIAFAGIYRSWPLPNGNAFYSASIITVAPHSKMTGVHEKAFPLMLNPAYEELIDAWLNPHFHEVEAFNDVLSPVLLQDFTVQPINKPSQRIQAGPAKYIASDFS